MSSLARVLPAECRCRRRSGHDDDTIFERLGALKNTTGYFGHRGWAPGLGSWLRLGVQACLARASRCWPCWAKGRRCTAFRRCGPRPVIELPVTFVICNNAQYQILKAGAAGLGSAGRQGGQVRRHGSAWAGNRHGGAGAALGVEAERVSEPDELAEKVGASLADNDGPRLFDVPIERTLAGPG